jgi:hypothetical protein
MNYDLKHIYGYLFGLVRVLVHTVKTATFWKWFPSPGREINTVLGLSVELLIPWAGFSVGISAPKNKC